MKVIKLLKNRKVSFGGEEHSGWLPESAAVPPPTPIEVCTINFQIVQETGGYLLIWEADSKNRSGDTWHETIEDAIKYADASFGIKPEEWSDV